MDGNQVLKPQEISATVKQRTAPPATGSAELVKYVLVELDVLSKDHQAFQHAMIDFVELMFDHKRWELVFASYPMTGVLNRFVHIWKIPDESDVLDIMREGAFDRGEPPALEDEERGAAARVTATIKARGQGKNPAEVDAAASEAAAEAIELVKDNRAVADKFHECYRRVQALIQRTSHTLMTSLPYDPCHVGFQSQTILVDADGDLFLIDHAKLRSDAKELDEAKSLEKVRRSVFTRRLRSGDVLPPHAGRKKDIQSVKNEAKLEVLSEVQKHLNRGTPVARLKSYAGKALLFNLAGLKARSVFQPIKPPPNSKEPSLGTVQGDGNLDLPVERILMAMPWGGVYDLTSKKLEELAVPIDGAQKVATMRALGPILDGLAPLAAIPEERDDVIGDGCACFVINLRSFVSAKLPKARQ
jgi:hypothetical protein